MLEKYDIVGKIFTNKAGYKFEVICKETRSKNSIQLYMIRFIDSGYVAHNISSGHIRRGEVKDYFSPSVFGVGCLGYATGYAKRNGNRRLYYTWRGMIRRCYDLSCPKYEYYGGNGVTVCERWHRLDYFIEDVTSLPGYNEDEFNNSKIELDKDILGESSKIYSPETCCFVSHAVNNREALYRRWHKSTIPS